MWLFRGAVCRQLKLNNGTSADRMALGPWRGRRRRRRWRAVSCPRAEGTARGVVRWRRRQRDCAAALTKAYNRVARAWATRRVAAGHRTPGRRRRRRARASVRGRCWGMAVAEARRLLLAPCVVRWAGARRRAGQPIWARRTSRPMWARRVREHHATGRWVAMQWHYRRGRSGSRGSDKRA